MIQQWINGKTLLFFIAVSIVTGTIFYSRYLSEKIAEDRETMETMGTARTPETIYKCCFKKSKILYELYPNSYWLDDQKRKKS